MNARGVRFDFAPLEEAARAVSPSTQRALGISGASVRKYRQRELSYVQADRLAGRLGLHPSAIWSDWFEDDTTRLFNKLRRQLHGAAA